MATKKKPVIENKEPTNKHSVFSFMHRKEKPPGTFDIGKFDYVNLKAGSVKFKSLYGRNSLWKRYLIAIILGIVIGTVIQFLIKNTGLYNSGLNAIVQGIARITNTVMLNSSNQQIKHLAPTIFNVLFWGLYIVANIPLFIFAHRKIGRTFANLTMVFVVVNSLWGFALSYIPGIDHIFLFGNSIAEGKADAFEASNNLFVLKKIYNIPFWYEAHGGIDHGGIHYDAYQIFNPDYDPYKALLLFIYAIAYGFISALCYAILYIIGGCSAGGDFISIYYSSIKHKPLGGLMIIVNSSMMLIGSIIGSYISAGLVDPQGFAFPFFLSANLVTSFVSVVIFGLLINRFFPLHRIVKVEIISEHLMKIRNHLFDSKFTHSMTISKGLGAYTLEEKDILWTVCMYVEVPNLIGHIHKVDEKALVVVTTITDVAGYMKIYRQGSTD